MNPRERRLVIIVAVVAFFGLGYKFAWPSLSKALDVQSQIDDMEDELAEYQEQVDQVDDALLKYKEYVARSGGTDPMQVRNRLQDQLLAMVAEAGLTKPRITPRNPTTERKTGLQIVSFGISGDSTLEAAVGLLKKCYELPYLARLRDVRLDPVAVKKSKPKGKPKRGRQGADKSAEERVKLNATLEVCVVPDHMLAQEHLDLKDLEQPSEIVRHAGESYAVVWERRPFSEWEPPAPKPKPKPKPEPKEPVKKPVKPKPTPKPPEPKGDRDARHKRVAMALKYGVDELLIVNTKRKTQQYVATGQAVDGGELIYVHPAGGIVRKDDGDYFYELGKMLSDSVPVDSAVDYPVIQEISERLEGLRLRNKPAPDEESQPATPDDVDTLTEYAKARMAEEEEERARAEEEERARAAEEAAGGAGKPKAGRSDGKERTPGGKKASPSKPRTRRKPSIRNRTRNAGTKNRSKAAPRRSPGRRTSGQAGSKDKNGDR